MGAFAWNPNDFSGGGGSGNVNGPGSSTDNAIARFNGSTGKLIQNSSVTIDDSGNLLATGSTSSPIVAGLLNISTGQAYLGITTVSNDPYVVLREGTTNNYWSFGLDYSASKEFAIYNGSSLGTGSRFFSVSQAGLLTAGNSSSLSTANFTANGRVVSYQSHNADSVKHRYSTVITRSTSAASDTFTVLTASPTGTSDAMGFKITVNGVTNTGLVETWIVMASAYFSGTAQYTTPVVTSLATGTTGMTDITSAWSGSNLQITLNTNNAYWTVEIEAYERVGNKITSSFF